MSDSIWVAYLGGFFGLAGVLITFLMNLSLRVRVSQHEASLAALQSELRSSEERLKASLSRDLAAHESRLRIEAEMKLRSHDRSWGLLREFATAVHHCREKLDNFSGTIRAGATMKTVHAAWEDAAASVAKFESLCAAAPPMAKLEPVCVAFQNAYADVGGATYLESQREALLEKGSSNIEAALRNASIALAEWNRRLWASAETLRSIEVDNA